MADRDLAKVSLVQPACKECDLPEGRSGHRIVVTPEALYSVGGYNPDFREVDNSEDTIYPLFNELWKFNFSTRLWQKLRTEGQTPCEMASHTACLIGDKLFVHGGTGTPFGNASSNRLNVCDLKTLTWKYIETSGSRPEKLYGHTLTLVDDRLYMFGGTTGFEYRNSLHSLNMRSREWTHHDFDRSISLPTGRYRHECVCDGRYLYILGGGYGVHEFGFEKIDVLNLEKCRWETLSCHGDKIPAPRRCHAAIKYKHFAIIIGGYNRRNVFSDVWRLDLRTLIWRKQCELIEPVYFHSADVTPDGCVYIYGGVNAIDGLRNSRIYRFHLDPPSLLEQSWNVITTQINNILKLPEWELLQLGIPAYFLSRL